MAVKVRLARLGKKNDPKYRIVAIDSRRKRDGKCIEDLGTYDPIKGTLVQYHVERINDWIAKGAILSETVARLYKQHKKSGQTSSPVGA